MQRERTAQQIAWAAGLFEGEGCWNAYKRTSGKIQVQARLGMTDKDIVERFAAIIGCGAIHESRPGTGGHKPVYTWCVYEAEKVRDVIALLLPLMGERRRAQALNVLEVGANVRSHNSRKTHCPKGHPLEGENLIVEPYRRAGKTFEVRRCRTCRERQAQERRARRLA